MARLMEIEGRKIGPSEPPLVIAEIGINHEGSIDKAIQMVDAAVDAGCECVKFQCHILEDEMAPVARNVVPGHTKESIWEIMERCLLTEAEDRQLMDYVQRKGVIYMSTPFSRAAANRLEGWGVTAYKIGSGECNNYPLVKHIAGFGKPIILSTGMNDIDSVRPSVEIMEAAGIPYGLLHCTSLYPTPYDKVRLGAITDLAEAFPNAVVGFSDHSLLNYAPLASVALGASIIEKHFTCDKSWPGPDVALSMDPPELKELIEGSRAAHQALGGHKTILADEQPTIDFAYACVVTIAPVKQGEVFGPDNIWVKRPGTGEIKAVDYESLFGKVATEDIPADEQVCRHQVGDAPAG